MCGSRLAGVQPAAHVSREDPVRLHPVDIAMGRRAVHLVAGGGQGIADDAVPDAVIEVMGEGRTDSHADVAIEDAV